jgi:TonB family protein
MHILRVLTCVALLGAFGLAQESVRMSESDARKAIVSKVEPEYPVMARQMHLTGRVVVDVYIDETGKVDTVKPISGNQLLTSAAVAAVKKWKFSAQPQKAVTAVAFDFKM